uniref:Ribonuclease P protein subunit p30 n=1 Tax=Acrobeloides nanus TaxID=290746 RepID=A0A914EJ93_9BILA
MEVDDAPSTSLGSKFMQKPENKLPNRAQPLHKFQFAEMNLKHTGNPDRTLTLVKRAIRMGYDSVVINIDIGDPFQKVDMETDQPPKKKKKKGQNQANVELLARSFVNSVTINESTALHTIMHHSKLKQYDLIAVRVEDEEFLTTFSTKGEFLDIITFNPVAGKVPWIFKKKIIQRCIETGIGFELCYGEALSDKNERRQFLTNARLLMKATLNGRNVFISSGTDEMICIRAPFDTANMSTLFGINPKDARKFVSANPKQILLRSQARKTIKGAIYVTGLDNVPSAEKSSKEALADLAAIPEFKKQIKISENKEEKVKEKNDGILKIF